jgi:hypothetical protein
MINIIWIFIGSCITLFWLFLIGGLIPPIKKYYVVFSVMTLFNAGYLFTASQLYQSPDLETALFWARTQCSLATSYIPFFVYFTMHILDVRNWKNWVFASTILVSIILVINQISDVPFWTPTNPRLLDVKSLFGEDLHVIFGEHNFGILFWYSMALAILVATATVAYRKKRWLIFSSMLILPLGVIIDFTNDTFALGLPYFTEFGFTSMGMLLASSLAIDYRHQKLKITHAISVATNVRDQLNTPLQVVTLGLESIQPEKPIPPEVLEKMKKNVQTAVELSKRLRNSSLFPDKNTKH